MSSDVENRPIEIEEVAEMARAVAALPQAERDYFEGMVADERAKAAEAERIAKLRAMPGEDALQQVIRQYVTTSLSSEGALQLLQDAGFVRLSEKDAEILKGIQSGIISREEFERAFGGFPMEAGRIEELPPGTFVSDVSDDHALIVACRLLRNSALVRSLIGREAGKALFDELAKSYRPPQWAVA